MTALVPVAVGCLTTLGGVWLVNGADAASVAPPWTPFDGGPDCVCADGSDVLFQERVADPLKVVLHFEGGGACWSAQTCAFDSEERTYAPSSAGVADALAERGGIFDAMHPQNPLAGYTFVVVPYCTGDAHLGTATTRYAADLSVQHRGFVNASAALDHLVATYPDVTELVVTGSSAGSIPTPLFAALAADRLPGTRIVSLGDSSGAFPDDPALNVFIGSLWGTAAAIPDWPVVTGVGMADWSIPGLTVYAGRHAPEVRFARFDHAFDEVQAFYGGLVGVTPDELVVLIDDIEATIEAEGVEVASYVAPGDAHTILGQDAFYELEVGGVRLVDWVRDVIEGREPEDVHCIDCSVEDGVRPDE